MEKVKAAAEVFKDERAALFASKKPGVWEVPIGLDPTQILPCHTLHFISKMLVATIFTRYAATFLHKCDGFGAGASYIRRTKKLF